ncbi:MAG: HEAT repeat domain-containing protein, partial [Planctomycetota bacterium]|nr:HEAT repeat domain-containing protein [Planctomycetota bacterium]
KWYPDAERNNHRVALAATLAAAREKRPDAKERLVELLRDRNPVYRAGAAYLLEPYDVDLRAQLSDPHPLVRRAAIPGVARLHHDALVPLLEDKSTVLRRAAALALATKWYRNPFDFIAKQKDLRRRCREVLEQCVALRPDHAELHRVLAALYDLDEEAEKAARARARHEKLVKPS